MINDDGDVVKKKKCFAAGAKLEGFSQLKKKAKFRVTRSQMDIRSVVEVISETQTMSSRSLDQVHAWLQL